MENEILKELKNIFRVLLFITGLLLGMIMTSLGQSKIVQFINLSQPSNGVVLSVTQENSVRGITKEFTPGLMWQLSRNFYKDFDLVLRANITKYPRIETGFGWHFNFSKDFSIGENQCFAWEGAASGLTVSLYGQFKWFILQGYATVLSGMNYDRTVNCTRYQRGISVLFNI